MSTSSAQTTPGQSQANRSMTIFVIVLTGLMNQRPLRVNKDFSFVLRKKFIRVGSRMGFVVLFNQTAVTGLMKNRGFVRIGVRSFSRLVLRSKKNTLLSGKKA